MFNIDQLAPDVKYRYLILTISPIYHVPFNSLMSKKLPLIARNRKTAAPQGMAVDRKTLPMKNGDLMILRKICSEIT
jgi:hypothetical protein